MNIEIFFDYACPYCLQGHRHLTELLPAAPALNVVWRPCEAHPRPDRYGLHSDLCARGMYIAEAYGVDLSEYHRRMYSAALSDRVDIEDPCAVAAAVADLLDEEAFLRELRQGAYLEALAENNRLAWAEHRFAAVPSLVLAGERLLCAENVGLDRDMITAFFEKCGVLTDA